jgi:signal transduction histidine kinase
MRSIRARLSAVFGISTGLLALIALAALTAYARAAVERQAGALLHAATIKVTADLEETLPRVDAADLIEDTRPGNISLRVTDAGGKVLYETPGRFPALSDPEWRFQSGHARSESPAGAHEATFAMAMPQAEAYGDLRRMEVALAILGLFIAGATTAGAWILVGRTLVPIARISAQAREAAREIPGIGGQAGIRIDAPSRDAEIVELVSTLNDLLARIKAAADARERFHAEVSHEFRSPLQALSGELELALSRQRSPEEYRSFVGEAWRHLQRLMELTREVLLLHELDTTSPPRRILVDPGDMCHRGLNALRQRIEARGLAIEVRMDDDVAIDAAPGHAEILIRNLLDNAAARAPENGRLSVAVVRRGDDVVLQIVAACDPTPDAGQPPPAPQIRQRAGAAARAQSVRRRARLGRRRRRRGARRHLACSRGCGRRGRSERAERRRAGIDDLQVHRRRERLAAFAPDGCGRSRDRGRLSAAPDGITNYCETSLSHSYYDLRGSWPCLGADRVRTEDERGAAAWLVAGRRSAGRDPGSLRSARRPGDCGAGARHLPLRSRRSAEAGGGAGESGGGCLGPAPAADLHRLHKR